MVTSSIQSNKDCLGGKRISGSLKVYKTIENVMGFNKSIILQGIDGQEIPSGIKTTIFPPANSRSMQTYGNLQASEFFTNYNLALIKKIRDYKMSTGRWL